MPTLQAGRQHYCINQAVLRSGRVDDGCAELNQNGGFGCRFHSGKRGLQDRGGHDTIHDIEDLKKTCTRLKLCPYYKSHDLALDADIVFCPYRCEQIDTQYCHPPCQ